MTAARALVLALLAIVAMTAHAGEPPRSGREYLSPELRARQDDDFANPGMLWVTQGETLWQQPQGTAGKSCASCHGPAEAAMRGVAARYPAFDGKAGRPINLEQRINRCRSEQQKASPLAYESDALLALTAYVAHQSRGMPVAVSVDGAARLFFEAGRAFFMERQGQLNLACAQCHDENAGRRLRGDVIIEGYGNGFPAYRLEWQTLGSLHRRLRACSMGVRAVVYDHGAPEYVDLELYLAWRGRGVPIETPALRR